MTLSDNSWREQHACAGVPLEMFFPVVKGISRKTIEICNSCPVKTECLNYAISNGIEYGIWGGMTERERAPLMRTHQKLFGKPMHDILD